MKNYIKYAFFGFVLTGSFFSTPVRAQSTGSQKVTITLPSSNYAVYKRTCGAWKGSSNVCDNHQLKDLELVKPIGQSTDYNIEENSYYYIMLNGKQVVKDARLGKRDFVKKTSWTIRADGTDIIG